MDPKKASYGVENPLFAVTQLAQTTMRSDIGKITLDKTFAERDTLNKNIVEAIRCRWLCGPFVQRHCTCNALSGSVRHRQQCTLNGVMIVWWCC